MLPSPSPGQEAPGEEKRTKSVFVFPKYSLLVEFCDVACFIPGQELPGEENGTKSEFVEEALAVKSTWEISRGDSHFGPLATSDKDLTS
jgi:hypothetical protein